MNIVGITSFAKLATNIAVVARNLHMLALNVVIKVGGLSHVVADSTLPLSTAQTHHF